MPQRPCIVDSQRLLERLLADVGALKGCCASIGRRYFGGHEVLFPAAAEELESLDQHVQALADLYRRAIAGPVSVRSPSASGDDGTVAPGLDLEGVVEPGQDQARQLEANLVAMAKAEALCAMGERKAVVELLERHLGRASA